MTLQKVLFEPTLMRSPLRVVQWWESRRLFYNVVVGGTGLVSVATITLVDGIVGGHWRLVPWQAVLVYGALANICYTSGWLVENVMERWMKRPIYGFGPALFRYGLAFSVGLTLLPAFVMTAVGVITAIAKLF